MSARAGVAYAVAAFVTWGFLPVYYKAVASVPALEVLAHRILWTLAVCALVLLVRRDLGWVRPLATRRRLVAGLALTGVALPVTVRVSVG